MRPLHPHVNYMVIRCHLTAEVTNDWVRHQRGRTQVKERSTHASCGLHVQKYSAILTAVDIPRPSFNMSFAGQRQLAFISQPPPPSLSSKQLRVMVPLQPEGLPQDGSLAPLLPEKGRTTQNKRATTRACEPQRDQEAACRDARQGHLATGSASIL